ncbi:MAG: prolyl oligopeptidase family serine peptidase [Chloroflexi bacterium]|nr:prolyl oligopeptidase family serine peptidase [Chloroflexota bacterium]
MLAEYFRTETAVLKDRCPADINTADDWKAKRGPYREQLFEMLSLSPLPPRTDLKAAVTGKVEHELFTVEKLHFQSMPGLYVTANLYLPKSLPKPAPAILYVCGHGPVIKNGISYGNKTAYQHHGAWFARNGYVCLVLDTVQLGEIQGLHHGTYREGMWWWNARGYSSAGAEAWNCIRALDYLESRPEVDATRLGVTGRSGGGAYSWWVTALDDRIKAAAPVAGITDLQNHVVDGTVEGHCDCMFMVNTYGWDYPLVAALAAPRPLLICNSDKDSIFPLDGVVRLHAKVAGIYKLLGASTNLGLLITEGPHKDTQDLQLPVFRWFNRHLKGEDPVIEMAATKFFEPEQLKVFDQLPADERTSKIHETFVPAAPAPNPPESAEEWGKQREAWMTALQEKCFRGWPKEPGGLGLERVFSAEQDGVQLQAYEFNSQPGVRLRLYLLRPAGPKQAGTVMVTAVLDEQGWTKSLAMMQKDFSGALGPELSGATLSSAAVEAGAEAYARLKDNLLGVQMRIVWAFVAPRGIGLTAWTQNEKKRIHIRRRFMLLGQTLDGMRVWDIRRAVQALRSVAEAQGAVLSFLGEANMGVNLLYASLVEPAFQGSNALNLLKFPESHRLGPDYLNVLRVLDIPQAVALALELFPVHVSQEDLPQCEFANRVAQKLGWPHGVQVLTAVKSE